MEDKMMNKKHAFKFFTAVVIFGAAIAFILLHTVFSGIAYAGQGTDTDKAMSKIEKIKKAGKLVVGTSADYPPYEFHLLNEKEGDLVGIDIDIARVIADELGVKLEVKDLIFSRIFDTLNSGKIDIAVAGLTPTEERRKYAGFSDIYFEAIQTFVIRSQDSEKIKTMEDLRGKKVGTQKDSMQDAMARIYISGAEFTVRETIEELIIILEKGLVDAIILEQPVADSYVSMKKNFISIKCNETNSPAGSAVAVKKGDDDLLKEVNRILEKLKKEDKINEFVENARMLCNKK